MDYNIRLATLNDARKLAEVKIACWETTYRGIYPDEKLDNYDVLKNAEKFETIISREDIDLYVEVNGEIVGYMSCGVPVRSYADYEQEIGLLYLLKEFIDAYTAVLMLISLELDTNVETLALYHSL